MSITMAPSERTSRIFKVKLASLLFGLGSWITITGFWAELPLLIQELPEKWSLPSQLTLFIQAANLGPLVYWLFKCFNLCNEVSATHLQMTIGFISCLVLVFMWNKTVFFFNTYRSIPLMCAAFGLAIVDCTSSVTFLPFMARLKARHLTPYLIGEGLSGFIPIVVATIQGSSETSSNSHSSEITRKPLTSEQKATDHTDTTIDSSQILFGPSAFFTSLLVTLLISWAAFFYLNYAKTARKEYVPVGPARDGGGGEVAEMNKLNNNNDARNDTEAGEGEDEADAPDVKTQEMAALNGAKTGDAAGARKNGAQASAQQIQISSNINRRSSIYPNGQSNMSDGKYLSLQVILVYACLTTFGIFPPLQSYSNLPYGNWALHWVVILTGLAYPIGCYLALLKQISSLKWISIWTLVASVISIYIVAAAIMSPHPIFVSPLENGQHSFQVLGIDSRTLGGSIMIVTWTLYFIILSYVKTVITVLLSEARGEDALFIVGLITQFASLMGAAFMFIAVNYFQWFKEE